MYNKIKVNGKKTKHKLQDTNDDQKDTTEEDIAGPQHERNSEESLKRNYTEEESDVEDQGKPKKKKKKQQGAAQIAGEGKKRGKKSIRQMKKEKHAQRQAESQAAVKDQLKSQCISYLSQWKHDRSNWKFMKAKQVWLYKNKFSTYLVPESSWPTLLDYFEAAKGNIRIMLLHDANKIIKQMDEWIENHGTRNINNEEELENTSDTKPDETSYKRARDLIQCLVE